MEEQVNADNNMRNSNLASLTWAHAVNNQLKLVAALNSKVDMIEADIVMGHMEGSVLEVPIMAHPPATTSDLTLSHFLSQIAAYNQKHVRNMKGIKLDFKSIEVFEGALLTLDVMLPNLKCAIWLNADIIAGPVNATETVPVDAARFFKGCHKFPQAVLSIGWTTLWGPNFNEGTEAYTQAQVNAMLESIKVNNITKTGQAITFPVRAGIAANSLKQMVYLMQALHKTNDITITIWTATDDFIDIEKLRALILHFGLNRVYIDVPDELKLQLNLPINANAANSSTMFNTIVGCSIIIAGLILTKLMLTHAK